MTKVSTDIDIDFTNRDEALAGLLHVPAIRRTPDQIVRHASGVYFQNIPTDPINTFSALDYEDAAEHGYFKIDFLNNSIYSGVRDEDHLIALMEEPEWDMLEVEEIVGMLAHIHDKFGLVQMVKPRSVEDLAVVLALMRPGKRHLIGQKRADIDAEIWQASDKEQFTFKKAHAIAYAVSIVVQLNLLCETTAQSLDAQ